MYSKPNEPYIHVNYRKEIYNFLKYVYKDITIKVNNKEIPIPITSVYPKNFKDLPCITYNQVNEVSSKNNLTDQFFPNPINDPNDIIFNYTPNEWNREYRDKNTEVVKNTKVNEVISKYTPSEWNRMMLIYKTTGEKLWEDTSEEKDEETNNDEGLDTQDLEDNNTEGSKDNKEENTVPSTPLEFPFKPYNPLIYTYLEYQIEYWAENITEIVKLINRLDEYLVHTRVRLNKTFTSADLYESDAKIYHKIVRYKALVDNHGNVYKGW